MDDGGDDLDFWMSRLEAQAGDTVAATAATTAAATSTAAHTGAQQQSQLLRDQLHALAAAVQRTDGGDGARKGQRAASAAASSSSDDDDPMAALRRGGALRQQQQKEREQQQLAQERERAEKEARAQERLRRQQEASARREFHANDFFQVPDSAQLQQQHQQALSLEDELHLASRQHNALSEPDRNARLAKWKALLRQAEEQQDADEQNNDDDDNGRGAGGDDPSTANKKKRKFKAVFGAGLVDDVFDSASIGAYAALFSQAWTLDTDTLLQRRARAQLTAEAVYVLELERDEGRRRGAAATTTSTAAGAGAASTTAGLDGAALERQLAHLPPARAISFPTVAQTVDGQALVQQCLDIIHRDRFASPEAWIRLLAEMSLLPLHTVRHVWQYAIKTFPASTWLVADYVDREIEAERALRDRYETTQRNYQHQLAMMAHHQQQQQQQQQQGPAAVLQQQQAEDRLALLTARLRILDAFEAHLPVCVGSSVLHARFLRYAFETVRGIDEVTQFGLCKASIHAVGRTFDAYTMWKEVLRPRQNMLDEKSVRITRGLFHALLAIPMDELESAKRQYLQFEKQVQRRDNMREELEGRVAVAYRTAVNEFTERRNLWEIVIQRHRWPDGVVNAARSLGPPAAAGIFALAAAAAAAGGGGGASQQQQQQLLTLAMLQGNKAAGPHQLRQQLQQRKLSAAMMRQKLSSNSGATTSMSPWCAPTTTDGIGMAEFNFTAMQMLPSLLPVHPSALFRLHTNDQFAVPFAAAGATGADEDENGDGVAANDDDVLDDLSGGGVAGMRSRGSARLESDVAIAGRCILGYHCAWDALIELETGNVSFASNSADGAAGGDRGRRGDGAAAASAAFEAASGASQKEVTVRARRVCALWEQRCRADPHATPSHWAMWARWRQTLAVATAKLERDMLPLRERLRHVEAVLSILLEGVGRFPESVVLANALADALTAFGDVELGNHAMFQLSQYTLLQAKSLLLLEQEIKSTAALINASADSGGGGGVDLVKLQQQAQAARRRVEAMCQLIRARTAQTFCDVEEEEDAQANNGGGDSVGSTIGAVRVSQYVVPLALRFCDRPRAGDWALAQLAAAGNRCAAAVVGNGTVALFEAAAGNPALLANPRSSSNLDPLREFQAVPPPPLQPTPRFAAVLGHVKDAIAAACAAWMRWVLRSKSARFWDVCLGSSAAVVTDGDAHEAQQQQQQQVADTALMHMRSVARYAVGNCGVGRHSLFLHAWVQLEAGCGTQQSAAEAVARICSGWERSVLAAIAASGEQMQQQLQAHIAAAAAPASASMPAILNRISNIVHDATTRPPNSAAAAQQPFLTLCGADALFFESLRTLDLLRSACGVSSNSGSGSAEVPIFTENAVRSHIAATAFEHVVAPAIAAITSAAAHSPADQPAVAALAATVRRICTNEHDALSLFDSCAAGSGGACVGSDVCVAILRAHCPALLSLAHECGSMCAAAEDVLGLRGASGLSRPSAASGSAPLSDRVAAVLRASELAVGARSTAFEHTRFGAHRNSTGSNVPPLTVVDACQDDDEACIGADVDVLFRQTRKAGEQYSSAEQQQQQRAAADLFFRGNRERGNRVAAGAVLPDLENGAGFKPLDQSQFQQSLLLPQPRSAATAAGRVDPRQQQQQPQQRVVVKRHAVDIYDSYVVNRHNQAAVWSWDAAAIAIKTKAAAPVPVLGVNAATLEQQQAALRKLTHAAGTPAVLRAVDAQKAPLLTRNAASTKASTLVADQDADALTADLALGNNDGVLNDDEDDSAENGDGVQQQTAGKRRPKDTLQIAGSSAVSSLSSVSSQAQWDAFACRFSSSALVRLLHALPSKHSLAVRPDEVVAAEMLLAATQQQKEARNKTDAAASHSDDGGAPKAAPVIVVVLDQGRRAAPQSESGTTATVAAPAAASAHTSEQRRRQRDEDVEIPAVPYPRTDFVMDFLGKL